METIFGEQFFQRIMKVIVEDRFDGKEARLRNIDLSFKYKESYYLVQVKSSWNWGNASSIRKLSEDFNEHPDAIGLVLCGYGNKPNKKYPDFIQMHGKEAWEFITGDPDFHKKLMNMIPSQNYDGEIRHRKIDKLLSQFKSLGYVTGSGEVDWEKCLEYNSKSPR